MTENQPEPARTGQRLTPEQLERLEKMLAEAGIVLQPWQRRLLQPETLNVFYGTRRQADRWAAEGGTPRRLVVLATNPDALRGWSGPVREVFDAGWAAPLWQLRALQETSRNLEIIRATRG